MTAEGPVDEVKFVLEELAMGPRNSSLQPAVQKDLIKSATISGTNVEVVVAESYLEQTPVQEIASRSALAYTLTDLPYVHSVTISVNGEELKKANGQPFGKIHLSDIVTRPDVNPSGESLQELVLYFSNADGTGLVAETRTVSINPNESISKYIVTEIIKGPSSADLRATVPPDTKLLDARTSDGMCSIDFSKEFISKHTSDYPPEIITVYSIVNSLCEQSDIKNVQFMIEGERQDNFNNLSDFKSLFEARDLDTEVQP